MMSAFVDQKYINLVSCKLDRFKWKKNDLANCRCCFCGDSSSNKSKARGYFFLKKGSYFYKCHNCGISTNVYSFLEKINPTLCKDYLYETWKENGNVVEKTLPSPEFETKSKFSFGALSDCPTISSLEKTHIARKYVEERRIPSDYYSILRYAEDFSKLVGTREPEKRLIIPICDENGSLVSFQGRAIGNSQVKYITHIVEDKNVWFNMDRVKGNDVLAVEGPIDAMFLPNTVATMGLGNCNRIPEYFYGKKLTFVLDNEPRNNEVVEIMLQIARRGFNICVWPENIKYKDINEMVMNGLRPVEIEKTIRSNTYCNLEATFKIMNWRKNVI
jgi:hypothetical protein